MIRISALLIAFLLSAAHVSSQHFPLLHQQEGACTYSINTFIHTGSNTLTASNYLMMRRGGHLSSSAIQSISDELRDNNLIGGMYDVEYTGLHQRRVLPGNDSVFYIVRAGYHEFQEASFHRNAALLTLFGNQRFEGDTLSIGPFAYNHMTWYQAKAGIMKRHKRGKNTYYAGFTLGLNMGLRSLRIDVTEASLYTAPLGEWLSFHTNMSVSRTAGDGVQGLGPGMDLYFAWISESGSSASVSLTQLGYITWKSPGYRWQRDTIIRFDGVVIDNIFAGGDLWGDGITMDTLDQLFLSYGKPGRHTTTLPATFVAEYRQPIKEVPMVVRGILSYRTESAMRPRMEIYLDWQPHRRWIFTRSHTVGGYGGYSTGFGIAALLKDELWIHFAANDLYRVFSGGSEVNLWFRAGLIYRAGAHYLSGL